VPADPRDLPLSTCAARIEPRLAAEILATWERLFQRAPGGPATGSPGLIGTYLIRTGTEERELVASLWTPATDPDKRLVALVESMDRACRSGRVEENDLVDALVGPPSR